MFQLILATTIDDLPCLSIETFPHARDLCDRVSGAVDIDKAEDERLVAYLEAPPIGASFTLHDADHGEPVAVIVCIGAAS